MSATINCHQVCRLYPICRVKKILTIGVQGGISDWSVLLLFEVAHCSHPTWFISKRVYNPIVGFHPLNIVATINWIRWFGVHRLYSHASITISFLFVCLFLDVVG